MIQKHFLQSITLTNFRSIRDEVFVPLDAAVVLIHGNNGSGKTSILSAIELALTGQVPTLMRVDPSYKSFLVHQDTERASISLATSIGSDNAGPIHLTRTNGSVPHLLDDAASHFFSERCNLAQASLSRLLELYQTSDARVGSPLTTFVKELLRLDRLDAIVDGLKAVGNITRVYKLVPEFDDLINDEDNIKRTLLAEDQQLNALKTDREETEKALRTALSAFSFELSDDSLSYDAVENALNNKNYEEQEIQLIGIHRELESIIKRLKNTSRPSAEARHVAELRVKETRNISERWMTSTGHHLESMVDHLRTYFPDLPSISVTDAITVHSSALSRITLEVNRIESALKKAAETEARVQILSKQLIEMQARLRAIDEQINSITIVAGDLGRALAGLLPHITGEHCPVCDRDYQEISAEPLIRHVTAKVANLTFLSEKLQELNQARQVLAKEIANVERSHAANVAARLDVKERGHLTGRLNAIEPYRRQLLTLSEDIKLGSEHMRAAADAIDTLAKLDVRDRLESEGKANIADIATRLRQQGPQKTETTLEATSRLLAYTISQREVSDRRNGQRDAAKLHLQHLRRISAEIQKRNEVAQILRKTLAHKSKTINSVKAMISNAKIVRTAAISARTAIVRDVFSDSLNKLWRELFIRLAPSEPFVPAFKIPKADTGPVLAELETRYRPGGLGGTPGTMLSAGNLNTAALTLFLSLHLSVAPLIKCLVLDDPVQSMDEVHIAQFAALLRTLSRQLKRQIIIAVHDRPLFDYLALELSPSAPGDSLMTVELAKSLSGSTTAISAPLYYEEDPVVFAA